MAFGSEVNPLWGNWRYLLAVVPYLAVGAAAFVDHLDATWPRLRVHVVSSTVTVAALAHFGPTLFRPIDSQEEHAFARSTTPAIAARYRALVIANDLRNRNVTYHAIAAMGIALGAGGTAGTVGSGDFSSTVRVYTLSDVIKDRSFIAGDPAAVFLGLFQSESVTRELRARFDLVPIEEREVVAAPALQGANTHCPYEARVILGASLPDCRMRVGWYELRSR